MSNQSNTIGGKKILLVEDDLFLTKIIAGKILAEGCLFLHADSGEKALSMLESEVPDVIFLDILFPGGMDGFEVLKQIKERENLNKVPVVILSNMGDPADVERGMSLGAFRYIVKASISPSEIIAHIESAVNSKL
jgi:CheY-like chemotaxis protein